ncbi:amidohydrolase family protein [Apiospora arundinis]
MYSSAILPAFVAAAQASSVLLSGGTVIAFDQATQALNVIRNGSVLIEEDRIAGVYESGAAVPTGSDNATEVVDCSGKIISPGFVDTHRHGWQTGFKTIASNTSLAEYFNRFGEFVAGDHLTADDVYIGQLAGLYEAINAGTTTSLDHAHHTWSNATSRAGLQASIDSGARVFWAYAFHNVTDFSVPDQIADFRGLLNDVPTKDTLVTPAMAYDSFYANPHGQETLDVMALAREYNISAMTAHYLGGPWSTNNSPELLHELGFLNDTIPVVFSHGSFATKKDAELLHSCNQYISNTPESEMHYGHTHEPSIRYGIQDQMALGVDTFFTYSTDMATQARIWLQHARYALYLDVLDKGAIPPNDPMSVNQAFLMATRAGGQALRRDDIGVIAKGAVADVLVYDGRSPSLLGWVDPVAALVLHANPGDLEHVLVGGKFAKRDGKLTAANYAKVQDKLLESAARIQATWRDLPIPAMDGNFMSGAPYVRAEQVNVMKHSGVNAAAAENDGYGVKFV